jgi:acetylornithine deacetylase/succinyl-diaminopimelate desuccinylase-like protein
MGRSADDEAFASVGDDLARLVRIPSLSLADADPEQVEASAREVAVLLAAAGAAEVEILRADGGKPAVLAHWPAPPGMPTVLMYAHHDVQPSGPAGAWTTPPFEPVVRDGRLYGRGAADNKAGIVAHAAALRSHGGRPPIGVTVLVEGEEEIGSPTIDALLEMCGNRLDADLVTVADSAMLRAGQPAITVSMRGLVDCVVEVRMLDGAAHSGVFGGIVPDALSTLVRILASLHDADGQVAVSGLAGSPPEGLALEGAELRRHVRAADGVAVPGDDAAVATRAWNEPALSVLAIDAPRVARAANQLVDVASAKVSLRLPPGVRAAEAFGRLERHLIAAAPWGAQVHVRPGSRSDPITVNVHSPAFALAERVFAEAWHIDPIRIGTGGTIPIVVSLHASLPQAPIVIFGAADRSSRTHAPDESVDLLEVRRTALAEALLLEKLADF